LDPTAVSVSVLSANVLVSGIHVNTSSSAALTLLRANTSRGAFVSGVGVAGAQVTRVAATIISVGIVDSSVSVAGVNVSSTAAAVVGGVGAAWSRDDDAVLAGGFTPTNETSGVTNITVSRSSHVHVESLNVANPTALSVLGGNAVTSPPGPVVVGGVGVANAWWWATPTGSDPAFNTFYVNVSVTDSSNITSRMKFVLTTSDATPGSSSTIAGYIGGVGIVTRGLSIVASSSITVRDASTIERTVHWALLVAGSGGAFSVQDDLTAYAPNGARFTVPGLVGAGAVVVLAADDRQGNANFQSSTLEIAEATEVRGMVLPVLGRTAGPDAALIGVVAPAAVGWVSGLVRTSAAASFKCGTGPCVRLPPLGGNASGRSISVQLLSSDFTACSAAAGAGVIVATDDANYRPLVTNITAAVWDRQHPAAVFFNPDSNGNAIRTCDAWTPTASRADSPTITASESHQRSLTTSHSNSPVDTASASKQHSATASPVDSPTRTASKSGQRSLTVSRTVSASTTETRSAGTASDSDRTRTRTDTAGRSQTWSRTATAPSSTITVLTNGTANMTASPSVTGRTNSVTQRTHSSAVAVTQSLTQRTASNTGTVSPVQPASLTDTTRSGTVVAGTGLGIVAALAFPGIGIPLATIRAGGLIASLRRIGSENGCRGQDASEVPEFLNSPLGFGMADGQDYVTGTAVGAPVVVIIAGIVGAV
jgi:hypothetical protein